MLIDGGRNILVPVVKAVVLLNKRHGGCAGIRFDCRFDAGWSEVCDIPILCRGVGIKGALSQMFALVH
jgi:hypothetical protein